MCVCVCVCVYRINTCKNYFEYSVLLLNRLKQLFTYVCVFVRC